LFFLFIILSHFINCAFIWISKEEYLRDPRFDHMTLFGGVYALPYNIEIPWIDMSPITLYANMLILAECFMGSIMYGDIIPYTNLEEIYAFFLMVGGRIFISFLFAEISSYVASLH
jgi:hypothetical protein